MAIMKCPHCGREYSQQACKPLIPQHNYDHYPEPPREPMPCPGSRQHPRNAETDMRPLWKDGGNP